MRDMTDAMAAACSYPLSALRADGGAAAMDLLLQLQADQSRMTVARPRSLESTALGAATLAGLAEGVWSSLGELSALWEAETVFEAQAAGRDRRRGTCRLAARRREVHEVGRSRRRVVVVPVTPAPEAGILCLQAGFVRLTGRFGPFTHRDPRSRMKAG